MKLEFQIPTVVIVRETSTHFSASSEFLLLSTSRSWKISCPTNVPFYVHWSKAFRRNSHLLVRTVCLESNDKFNSGGFFTLTMDLWRPRSLL